MSLQGSSGLPNGNAVSAQALNCELHFCSIWLLYGKMSTCETQGTFQTFCTHIPAFLHKKTPAEPSLEGSATPSVCSQNPCHLRPAPQRMLWLQKVPQLCYYVWSAMARDFSYLTSTCHIMNTGCYTGIRVSRVVTK